MKEQIRNESCTRCYYRADYQIINVQIKIATQHVVNSKSRWNSGCKEKYKRKEIIKLIKNKRNKGE